MTATSSIKKFLLARFLPAVLTAAVFGIAAALAVPAMQTNFANTQKGLLSVFEFASDAALIPYLVGTLAISFKIGSCYDNRTLSSFIASGVSRVRCFSVVAMMAILGPSLIACASTLTFGVCYLAMLSDSGFNLNVVANCILAVISIILPYCAQSSPTVIAILASRTGTRSCVLSICIQLALLILQAISTSSGYGIGIFLPLSSIQNMAKFGTFSRSFGLSEIFDAVIIIAALGIAHGIFKRCDLR